MKELVLELTNYMKLKLKVSILYFSISVKVHLCINLKKNQHSKNASHYPSSYYDIIAMPITS